MSMDLHQRILDAIHCRPEVSDAAREKIAAALTGRPSVSAELHRRIADAIDGKTPSTPPKRQTAPPRATPEPTQAAPKASDDLHGRVLAAVSTKTLDETRWKQ